MGPLLQQQVITPEDFFKLDGPIIGTHDGRFHLDEVLGCCMLLSLSEFSNGRILRSRSADDWEKCTALIDVGGVYTPEKYRLDHHQRGFDVRFDLSKYENTNENVNTNEKGKGYVKEPASKLSSAGLVFSYFGEKLLKERFGIEDPSELRAMMREVYIQFIEAVDAQDNGVSCTGPSPPLFMDKTTLPCRVADLYVYNTDAAAVAAAAAAEWELLVAAEQEQLQQSNAAAFAAAAEAMGRGFKPIYNWRTVPILGGSKEEVWGFRKALRIADEAFASRVIKIRDEWLPGLPMLKEALEKALAGDLKEEAVELPKWGPIEGHIYSLERELGLPPIKYQVYPTERKPSGGDKTTNTNINNNNNNDNNSNITWTIRCIQKEGEQFQSRLPLKEEWRGLRDESLGEKVIAGIPEEKKNELINLNNLNKNDFVFCHATGFLGITKSRDAAYEMIRQTLEEEREKNKNK